MTHFLVVVDDVADWCLDAPGVEVVSASEYLRRANAFDRPRTRVVNLCRSPRYQSIGYYASLLAEARGHRPLPPADALLELRSKSFVRALDEELAPQIQQALGSLTGPDFVLSVYFGRNVAKRYDRLSAAIHAAVRTPMVVARFTRDDDEWSLASIKALGLKDVPEHHRDAASEALRDLVAGRAPRGPKRTTGRFDLAILHDPEMGDVASCPKAIEQFVKAGEAVGFRVRIIGHEDSDRIPEFDALFIRDTTRLNHYTHRFALKAKALGLVVMDDPSVIQKCMNKVFLAEVLTRHRIRTPKSVIVTRENASEVLDALGLPCVLKQPDGAFSSGVTKAETREELEAGLRALLDRSALAIAQEFRPTEFDWRIGVLDGQPLYACKYFMVSKHWQILQHGTGGDPAAGAVESIPVESAPGQVLDVAVRAASLYGDGLFGVDVKMLDEGPAVIEVNDNPTIDAGDEDGILGPELYARVMRYFMARVEQRKRAGSYL